MEVTGAGWLTWLAGSPGREKPMAFFTDASGQRTLKTNTCQTEGLLAWFYPPCWVTFTWRWKKELQWRSQNLQGTNRIKLIMPAHLIMLTVWWVGSSLMDTVIATAALIHHHRPIPTAAWVETSMSVFRPSWEVWQDTRGLRHQLAIMFSLRSDMYSPCKLCIWGDAKLFWDFRERNTWQAESHTTDRRVHSIVSSVHV